MENPLLNSAKKRKAEIFVFIDYKLSIMKLGTYFPQTNKNSKILLLNLAAMFEINFEDLFLAENSFFILN
jgi:hypothetical protein